MIGKSTLQKVSPVRHHWRGSQIRGTVDHASDRNNVEGAGCRIIASGTGGRLSRIDHRGGTYAGGNSDGSNFAGI